jgi:hypothetical protein
LQKHSSQRYIISIKLAITSHFYILITLLTGRSMAGLNANCKRVCTDVMSATKKVCLEGGQRIWEKEAEKTQEQVSSPVSVDAGSAVSSHKKVDTKLCSKYPELFEPHTFAPKDLLALLKNLENEISVCEVSLRDENDKRKKYKVRLLEY